MPIPDKPYTRKEAYLNAAATGDSSGIPETPYTREEMYLDAIARGGGGGGGSSTLSGLTDVDIGNPTDGQTLVYNAATGKWVNGAGGGGVLVCHIVMADETPTLDKTYREIVNADLAILKVIGEEEGLSGLWYLSVFQNLPGDAKSGAKSDAKATGWVGILTFVDVASTVENGVLSQYDFVADDPDDYPVAST